MTGISLPPSAMRLLDKRLLAQIIPKLQLLARQNNKRSVAPEVILWVGPGLTGDNAPAMIAAVATQIKRSGYAYTEKEIPMQTGLARGVIAQKQRQQIMGLWLSTNTGLFLA